MKYKLTICIVIAVLLIGGGIWETLSVHNTFQQFQVKLEELMQQEKYDYEDVVEVGEWWQKKSRLMEVTVPHVHLTEITVTYGELKGAVENEDFDSASALLNRIKLYAERIGDLYGLSVINIL